MLRGPPRVACPTEDSHSGLVRTIGNRVGDETPQGFKSPILRHRASGPSVCPGYFRGRRFAVPKTLRLISRPITVPAERIIERNADEPTTLSTIDPSSA